MAMIDEIHDETGTSRSSTHTLGDAIQLVINWCDTNPEKKIVKISWLFTLRCKHLSAALRVVLGLLPED